jgi:hypothetical protein
MNSGRLLPALTIPCFAFILTLSVSFADEVKLKTGEVYKGRITYEADDIIKIEIPVSNSIKETKVVGRATIAEIKKDAPDLVEYEKIQALLPTGSMIPASGYRQVLETGPDAFLRNFPQSEFAPKVTEVRKVLAEELDKVERGFLKLGENWVSPQDKIDYPEIVDSQVRFIRMQNHANAGNYNGQISALKEFEVIEKDYLGTPIFPKAVGLALEIIPALGGQMQNMLRNVDYKNAEYERNLAASTAEARDQVMAARAKEEKGYQDAVSAEKKLGVKWVQLNPRLKSSLETYLKFASGELARLRGLDLNQLAAQGDVLYEADKLIAAGQIDQAKAKIGEAAALTGQKVDAGSTAKTKSKPGAKSGSYLAALNAKISEKLAEEKGKMDARKAAADSEALTANLKKNLDSSAPTDPAVVPAEGTEGAEATEAPAADVDEFAALAGSKKGAQKPAETGKTKSESAKSKAKKTPAKSSKSDDDEDGDEDAPKRAPVVVEEEGGFPFGWIAPILTVLVIVAVVLMKVFGIGGKKSEE